MYRIYEQQRLSISMMGGPTTGEIIDFILAVWGPSVKKFSV
jgi:hypothetical protein